MRCIPVPLRRPSPAIAFGLVMLLAAQAVADVPESWRREWPQTDFSRHGVDLSEIIAGGPPKDGIPSIDDPRFMAIEDVDLADAEPVIGLVVNGDARAYPLSIMIWHEIVNDTVGGVPVAVTYCPLCNAAIAFDRRVDGRVLDFGTTGKLRRSDLVMYDRQTESWWQQFTGEAIVGVLTGTELETLPARLESFADFRERAPEGRVLEPPAPHLRPYGTNPYVGYDSAAAPFLYRGAMPDDVPPMIRVVAVEGTAWTLGLLRQRGAIKAGDLMLSWTPGQASALDTAEIAKGRDVGSVVVQRRTGAGLRDVPYDVTFAFVFFAFAPDGILHTVDGPVRWDEQ